jgi:hypothetical protein
MQRQQDFLTGHGLRYVEQQMKHGASTPPGGRHSSSSPAYHDSPALHEPDVNNAFSVEHFASNGFTQSAPPAYGGGGRARAQTDPFEQMTQEEQWAMFQDMAADNVANQTSFFPDPQISAPTEPYHPSTQGLDFPDGDELTLDEYTKSMEEFLQKNNLGNEAADLPADMQQRTKTLEDLKQDSWVKSFYSVDTKDTKDTHDRKTPRKSNGKKKRSTLDATIQRSQRSNLAMQSTGMSTRTDLTSGTQMTTGTAASKMSLLSGHFSAMSGVSMFSEMSEDSRSAKMGMARGLNSNLSMMSELTDLSESLKSLDLATGASQKQQHHHHHHH